MGQTIFKPIGTRRRLWAEDQSAVWPTYEDFFQYVVKHLPNVDKIKFRPFGGWNYSYGEDWERTASFSIWVAVTVGSLAVDWREAAIVLGGALWAQETIQMKTRGQRSMGASWVHNVQAGYLFYHMFIKGNKRWLVWLPGLYEGAADLVSWSQIWGEYADDAHGEGLVVGLISGYLLDQMFSKKRALL